MIDGQSLNTGAKEPLHLKRWPAVKGQLYSCARPGRGTNGKDVRQVDAAVLKRWLNHLPSASSLQIISLLGEKAPGASGRRGTSEFTYYPFRSCHCEADGRPTFQEWLISESTSHIVHEFPTLDRLPLQPRKMRDAAVCCVRELLERGMAVVVVDSGGVQRTGELCRRVLSATV